MRRLVLAFACLSVLLAGCKASVEVNANTGKKAEDDPEPPPSFNPADAPRVTTSRIGVTHNLSLTPEASQKAQCRCMAAVLGAPSDPAFQWRGTPPTVGDDAIVLGISSEGTPCDGRATGRGPSIQAVEEESGNLVVTIEENRVGIPPARGAVMKRPAASGGWVIFRASRRLPYDDALPGSGDPYCRMRLP